MQELTTSQCPPGPRELVSCACAKDRKSADMSRILVSSVKYYCGSDANADVTSAIAVFDYYCSAGKGLVTPEGVKAAGKDIPIYIIMFKNLKYSMLT